MILKDFLFASLSTGAIVLVIGIFAYGISTRKDLVVATMKSCFCYWARIWFYAFLWYLIFSDGEVYWSHWLGEESDLLFVVPGFIPGAYMDGALMIVEVICLHIFYSFILHQRCYTDVPAETAVRAILINVPAFIFAATSLYLGEVAYICLVPMVVSMLLSAITDYFQYRTMERGESIAIHPALRQLVDFGYMVTLCLVGCAICV